MFMKLLHQVPEFERLSIKQRLHNPALVKEWCVDVDYGVRLPLLAFVDGLR